MPIISPSPEHAQGISSAPDVHVKKTELLPVVKKPASEKPRSGAADLRALAAEADMDDVMDASPFIEDEKTDTAGARELQKTILEAAIVLKNSKKNDQGAPYLTAKGKRIMERYLPRLFEKTPTAPPGKKDFEIRIDPRSSVNQEGAARLLEAAGFDPETTTIGVLKAELPSKKAEVDKEIKRRDSNKKLQMELGSDVPKKQQEAMELLQDIFAIKDKALSPREAVLKIAEEEAQKTREEKDQKLKPLVGARVKREIESFARVFKEKYEAEEIKKKVAEQRARRTEISIKPIKPPTRWERFREIFTSSGTRQAKEETRQKLMEKKEQQDLEALLKKDPTFSKEGFLQSSGLQDLVDGNFATFDEMREKVVDRINKNERRLEETHSIDLAKEPIETLSELAHVPDYDLKRLLANNEVLERILSIIDQRDTFLEKNMDLAFDKEKLISPTTETYHRLSQIMPKIKRPNEGTFEDREEKLAA